MTYHPSGIAPTKKFDGRIYHVVEGSRGVVFCKNKTQKRVANTQRENGYLARIFDNSTHGWIVYTTLTRPYGGDIRHTVGNWRKINDPLQSNCNNARKKNRNVKNICNKGRSTEVCRRN